MSIECLNGQDEYYRTGRMPAGMNTTQLMKDVRGVLKTGESMAGHTSWRTGGPAALFFEPADLDDLCLFIRQYEGDKPLLWTGLGSNLLVRDGGFDGVVISYSRALANLEISREGKVNVDAGVPCAKVAKQSAREGYTGAEFLAGIPGCMGGAIAMNAGAFGGETWNIVTHVKTLDRSGNITIRTRKDFDIGYRSVTSSREEWFVSAELDLPEDSDNSAVDRIRSMLDKRSATQPTGLPSCGSVFRNPPEDHAARLIEGCGLKGYRSGDACISDKHANFIINLGGASSEDIESLINMARRSVSEKYSIELVPEVKIIGNFPCRDISG